MSSRSALLALLGLLAVASPARADDPPALTWNDGVQTGLGYWVVEFTREDGSRAEYFVRESDWKLLEGSDAKKNGGKIPLFKLQKLQNPQVEHPFFNTQLSAYHLVAEGVDRYARREGSEYKAKAVRKRSMVKVKVTATSAESQLLLEDTLDIVLWRESKSDQPYPVYAAFSQVVVAAPSGAPEAPPQTPVANIAGHGTVDYAAHRGGSWRKYYERMHPVQRMLPMTGNDLNKYAYPDVYNGTLVGVTPDAAFKKAYDDSAKGDHRATIALAREGLAKAAAKARTILDAEGPEAQLSADEMTVVMNALSAVPAVRTSPAGQARFLEMSRKANNPEKVAVFVAHWRAFIHELLHGFLEKAGKATDETVLDYAAELEAVRTLAAKYFADESVDFDKWKDGERPAADAPSEARPAATTDAVQLGAKETAWLTKVEAREYKVALEAAEKLEAPNEKRARKNSLATQTRARVAANLRPEAKGKYEAAAGKPNATLADIEKELPAKMWGEGEGDAAKAEIALTAAEVKKFTDAQAKLAEYAKNPRSLTADQHKVQDDLVKAYEQYLGKRRGVDNPQNRTVYDPIALRQATVAARTALGLDADGKPAAAGGDRTRRGGGRGAGDENGGEVSDADLTPDEIARLTPREKAQYEGTAGAATRKQWNRKLRERIQSENRAPYTPPAKPEELSVADFNKFPLWQKRRFCNDFVPAETGAAAAAGDRRAPDLQSAGTGQSADDLAASEAATRAQGGRPAMSEEQRKAMRDKFGELCSKLPTETMPEIDPGTGGSDHRTEVPDPGLGADKEEESKKEKKGPSDHAFNAMRGAILGALIGSLFGPLGAVLGAVAMGAAMYGFSKWKNPDKEE